MSKSAFTTQILLFEGVGFILVLGLLWLNEALDLPHKLLGAPATPVNWRESILESAVVLMLGAGTLSWTYHILARLRYLEGFVRICMNCKRVQTGDKWVPIEVYVIDHSEAVLSHSVCPECKEKYYAKVLK
jgi:hypothetical protein